jgi:thioredoxin 1
MADNIPSVTDASFQADVIEASKTQPVMVDFWADWCRPCKMLTPTVEEIAREHEGKLKVVKLNIDDNMGVPGKFNIRGIPTLLVFKGGLVADQIVGAVPKEQIVKVIERHITSS